MRNLAVALLTLLSAGPASAAMAPEIYEAARDAAPDVVVIAVAGVTPPASGTYGTCMVVGTVLQVQRGTRHATGDPISLAVECAQRDAGYPDGGALYEEMQSLLASTYGRAWLGPDGAIALWQYEQLTEADLP